MNRISRSMGHARVLRSDEPLNNEQIARVAPSVFADQPHGSRSERYTYIPTGTVLDGLRNEGFQPFMVCQTQPRDESKFEYAKHMIRLRHAGQIASNQVNEIILINSHDGTSSYQMVAGVFRFVCHNGLVCGDIRDDLRIRHQGDQIGQVIEGAYRVLDDFKRVDASRETMQQIFLKPEEQMAFAESALRLRYEGAPPIGPAQAMKPRRMADAGQDLWTTLNIVQENLVRGGQRGINRNNQRVTTRAVNGIDNNLRFNQALWVLAERMAELKAA